MHDTNSNTIYITHANISSCIYLHNLNHTTCYAISQSITPKISSLGLIIKHEQFNLNSSTKHFFTQKFILVSLLTCTVKPLGYYSRQITKHRLHFENPNFMAIAGLIHITIKFVSQFIQLTSQTAPHGHGLHKLVSKISHTPVPSFGTDQTTVQGLKQTETS